MPDKAERNRLMEVWRGAAALLTTLKKKDPLGKPELQLAPDTGVEIHWRSGRSNNLGRVVQVESVAEAARAHVAAGILAEADAVQEQRRLEGELESGMRATQSPHAGTEPGW